MKRKVKFIIVALLGWFSVFSIQAQTGSSGEQNDYSQKIPKLSGCKVADGSMLVLKNSNSTVNVVFDDSRLMINNGKGKNLVAYADLAEGAPLVADLKMGISNFQEEFISCYNNEYSKKTTVALTTDESDGKYRMEVVPLTITYHRITAGGLKGSGVQLFVMGLVEVYTENDSKPLCVLAFNRNYSLMAQAGKKFAGDDTVVKCFRRVAQQLSKDVANAIQKAKAPK